ncbi:MAG: hypothetical protein Q4D54_01525 [Eubacteriales bacterium]|nr:hypothetical protein [Lachnospiraceae bacterium]MDO5126412.1 hypothetical protein [Eubacteriales bacterium]
MGKNIQDKKSVFVFQVNDSQTAYQLIMSFLNTYKFVYSEKGGTPHYEYYDHITAKRIFEFYFNGPQITIYAYLRSPKNPMPIDKGVAGAAVKKEYMNNLRPLFEGLTRLTMSGNYMANSAESAAYGQQVMQNMNAEIKNNSDINAGNMAVMAFVLSIIGAFLCFFGFVYGVAILFIEVWAAIVGLESNKWPLSVAALLLCVASIIVCVSAYL